MLSKQNKIRFLTKSELKNKIYLHVEINNRQVLVK